MNSVYFFLRIIFWIIAIVAQFLYMIWMGIVFINVQLAICFNWASQMDSECWDWEDAAEDVTQEIDDFFNY